MRLANSDSCTIRVEMLGIQESSLPREFSSLRMLGFSETVEPALYSITLMTHASRPVLGDLSLAKAVLTVLLDQLVLAHLSVYAYCLVPDNLFLLAGVWKEASPFPFSLTELKRLTTLEYWKRAHAIAEGERLRLPPALLLQGLPAHRVEELRQPLLEWKAVVRPEEVVLKNWPRVRPENFLGKLLWQPAFNSARVKTDDELRSAVEQIAFGPVTRGYVSTANLYPFIGFGGRRS